MYNFLLNMKETPQTGPLDETGDKIFVWDYTFDSPQPSSRLDKIRFGASSITLSNRYFPECRSKFYHSLDKCQIGLSFINLYRIK